MKCAAIVFHIFLSSFDSLLFEFEHRVATPSDTQAIFINSFLPLFCFSNGRKGAVSRTFEYLKLFSSSISSNYRSYLLSFFFTVRSESVMRSLFVFFFLSFFIRRFAFVFVIITMIDNSLWLCCDCVKWLECSLFFFNSFPTNMRIREKYSKF